MPRLYIRGPLALRFAARLNLNGPIPELRPELGPCHLWTGYCMPEGYGQMRVDGKNELVHRVAFFLVDGRWPIGALHHCDNPPCARRSHIFEGKLRQAHP